MTAQPPPHAAEDDLAKIGQFNRTETSYPDHAPLQTLIEARVAKHASDTAVICDHGGGKLGTLTYARLNERANQLAHLLRAEGVGAGDLVALMVERSHAMIIGLLGIMKAGAAFLPLSPDTPPGRLDFMLTNGRVKTLLVHRPTMARAAFAGLTVDLDDSDIDRGSTANPAILNTPRDLAYVIYTSGSTGKPKGVMIEHRSLVNRLHWMQHAYPIDERDVILQKTPCSFDVSVWEFFWWLLAGAKLCLLMPGGEKHPLAIVEAIAKHRVSVLHFVPSMLNVFLEYLEGKKPAVLEKLSSVRRVFASGEALAPSHVRKFNEIWGRRTGARLTNLYGPTEATVDVTHFDCPTEGDFKAIPIGKPIHNIKLYIIRDGRQMAIGEPGELCIAGVGLARGYLNNEALTDEKFTDNPVNPGERIYRTGDIARWREDGNIEYLGREDHQVKIRGLRIELGEIENTVREYPGITDCVARIKKHSESVVLIIAYVVCRGELDVEGLTKHLAEHLPSYMIPNRFERLSELPLTPSGKADRQVLPEPALQTNGL